MTETTLNAAAGLPEIDERSLGMRIKTQVKHIRYVLTSNPVTLLAFTLSYLLQAGTLLLTRRGPLRAVAGPLAIGAGNRNIALFLVALPAEVIAPLMIFIGCWQLPMYLTPVLLPRLYERMLRND